MAREKLSAVQVRQAPAGKYGDGAGLWLLKTSRDTGSWMLRVAVAGKLRHMGLGSISEVTLAEARLAAAKWRAVARAGKDPIKERERERREASRSLHLLEDVARDAFEARKPGLRKEGQAGRWFNPIENYLLPKIGKLPVAEVDQIVIRDALKPIWKTRAATSEKALQRLAIVMKHAAALGYEVDLQACAKAKLLLGEQGHEVRHIPALHWSDVPAFYASLDAGSISHLALRFIFLSGLRSTPVRMARLEHIEGNVLTIPKDLMKGQKGKTNDFRLPLTPEMLAVIEQAKPLTRNGFLFSNPRGVPLSDMALSRIMVRREMEARPHGARSSLRVFLAERGCPREIAEAMLGHSIMGKVEASYQRSDLLDIRRNWLERWNHYVVTGQEKPIEIAPHAGQVIPLNVANR